MRAFLVLVYIYGWATWAETADSRYTHALLHARTAAEVSHVTAAYEELRVARLACRIQVRERLIPESCYHALHLEDLAHLHRPAQSRDLQRRLDDVCVAAHPEQVPSATRGLSKSCARHVSELRKVLEYRRMRL